VTTFQQERKPRSLNLRSTGEALPRVACWDLFSPVQLLLI